MSTPNDETARDFRVVSDEFIDGESDNVDVSSDIENDDSDAKSHGEDGTGDEIRNNHSQEVYAFKRNELKWFKILAQYVNWEIDDELQKFFCQLRPLVARWKDQLPDLRSIFKQDELDFLLIKAVISDTCFVEQFIGFVVRTGYKDRFEVPEDDKYKPSVLHRTTAIHHAARNKPFKWERMVKDLFKIYDRFDVNYTDELGLTHFHVACMIAYRQDLVQKFLEQCLVDPNLIYTETGDSPLHLSINVRHDCNEQVKILMRNGANPNLANNGGLTPLHMSVRSGTNANAVGILFEICEDMKQPLQVDAQDNLGNTPLHLALEIGRIKASEVLMRNGANPNLTNKDGSTPLHMICSQHKSGSDCGEAERFFKITDELNRPVQVDARDKLGRTPLQLAVANLGLHSVETLFDRGADLSSFVLPPEDDFTARFDPTNYHWNNFKLSIASSALAILESLEKRGYQVEDFVLIIMKIFSRIRLFPSSAYVHTRWYDNEEFASQAKQIQILPKIDREEYKYIAELERAKIETAMTPSLSFYDLIRLRPEEAAKIFTYRDYYCRDIYWFIYELPDNYQTYYRTYINTHFYEKVPRVFCRRWGLEYFYELIRYRLPILCCEKIIDQLMNEDLCNICFAATGQDPF